MPVVIDNRPNGNYYHIVNVWETGNQNRSARTREIKINYTVDVRTNWKTGSWTGGETRRFSTWVDGEDFPKDLAFDTRDGADILVVETTKWVYAGDGREIAVHAYFQGWSDSFPGFHDTRGKFWVSRVEPPDPSPPPATVNRPDTPTFEGVFNQKPDSVGVQYRTNGDGGAEITAHELEWCYPGGERVWLDVNCRGYTDPQSGTIPGAPALTPGTEYHLRARVGNSAGFSDWADWYSASTLPAVRLKSGSSWRWAIPHVKQDNAWRLAQPYGKTDSSWHRTI